MANVSNPRSRGASLIVHACQPHLTSPHKKEKTNRLERRDLLLAVGVEVLLDVVHRHTTDQVAQKSIRVLRDAVVRAVARLEVQQSRPVVGRVLGELAGRARGLRANIPRHGGVERIPSFYLMHVGAGDGTGLDDGVEALDDQLAASEAQVSLGGPGERDERSPLHLDSLLKSLEIR